MPFLIISVVMLFLAVLGPLGAMKPLYDPALRFGISGLIANLFAGTYAFFGALIFSNLSTSLGSGLLVSTFLSLSLLLTKRELFEKFQHLKFKPSWQALLILVPLLFGLVGALTPSSMLDWDSLAYHLAVPKLWLESGSTKPISFIHHSNFPSALDTLFAGGLMIGGEYGAKIIVWWTTVFGCFAVFGAVRETTKNQTSAWIGTLAFASIPMVIWESGTAYIDIAHGLYAGLGFYFVCRLIQNQETLKPDATMAAMLLAGAAGTKYTGLQAIFIAFLTLLIFTRKPKIAFAVAGGAFLLASPWYIKNWLLMGNPVYPFFFSVFGGKNWDAFQAMIYSEEQKTFGLHGPLNLGSALFGLASSPGRFTNPSPTLGGGFAWVSVGIAVLAGGVAGLSKGLANKFQQSLGFIIGLQLLFWFALSQQSRYIAILFVPLILLLAMSLEWKQVRPLLIGAVGLQTAISLYLINSSVIAERLPVLAGGLTRDEFLGGYQLNDGTRVPGKVSFYSPAKQINQNADVKKVALFDEVFGFYLDKPYIWATPGHTTETGYATMKTTDDFVNAFKKLGCTHAYLSTQLADPAEVALMTSVMNKEKRYTPEQRAAREKDQRNLWRVLFAEAVAEGKLVEVQRYSEKRALYQFSN